MAQTAVRVDTQVKGKVLTLGGAVTGYFQGDSNGDGQIVLKDANDAAQITFDAAQSGSGNFQIETTGDVHIGGNLVVDGSEIVEVSEFVADNLTAGNTQADNHELTGSTLFKISSANPTHVTIKDVDAGGGFATLRAVDSNNVQTFRVIASNGNLYTIGDVNIEGSSSVTGDFTVTGRLDASNATHVTLTQGSVIPAPSGSFEGDVFWQTGANRLWVYNGTTWQEAGGGNPIITLSDHLISTTAVPYSSITWIQFDLDATFPDGYYIQVITEQDTNVTGYYRLYNVTDNVLVKEMIVFGNTTQTTTAEQVAVPAVGTKLYKFEHKRSGGGGMARTFLHGATLRA
jgi:hypothetical protein